MILYPYPARLIRLLNRFLMLAIVIVQEFQGSRPFKVVIKELLFVCKLLYIEKSYLFKRSKKLQRTQIKAGVTLFAQSR